MVAVSETCAQSEDAQCYTISFTRSVFEGYDMMIIVDNSKTDFLLTIYSNTPDTKSLKGYTVTIAASCTGISDFIVHQSATQAPKKCEAKLVSKRKLIEAYQLATHSTKYLHIFVKVN